MRRLAALGLVAALAITACGSSAPTAPNGRGGNPLNGGGGNPTNAGGGLSGTGSAKVTVGGATTTISPGGCIDGGTLGVEIEFGKPADATADWVIGGLYHDGHQPSAISGRVGGKLFVLDDDRTGTIGSDGKGAFSGTDSLGGNGMMTATFSCS